MAGAKRSRTAQGVAAERAILAEMGVIDDPYSWQMLATSWKSFVGVVQHWPSSRRPLSVARAGLAARVKWHDAHLVASLQSGIRQVAVIGAGYDTRAWRFSRDGVVFFELDHPSTQEDKRLRAPQGGAKYVAADLNEDDAAEALARCGLDASRPAHFIVEGVTMYLSEAVVREQLLRLSEATGAGSRLSIDFYPPMNAGSTRDRRLMWAQRLARTGSGENVRLQVDRAQAGDILAASGWDPEALTSMRAVAVEQVPDRFGLPVHSINEHKTLAVATCIQRT